MIDHYLLNQESLFRKKPLSAKGGASICRWRQEITSILKGEDPRLLLIVGPCSIHDVTAGLEYARRLKELANEVQDSFFIVMRSYLEKSRTCHGWKGLITDPDLDESCQIQKGLLLARRFLLNLVDM
ncbi:MAG TPA: 3-deoxy-7-phosphoheptulonate synthase, partial [Chlamydiales bacterium]|nr:3-deoxy-7-phosphoheptulonate synthase [Chlamydiales bacterium]